MKITRTEEYQSELLEILKYIANDKISASKTFRVELNKQIKNIPTFPYKYKKSIYFNDESIRDMTFKKYTIIYRVKPIKQEIEILRIFKKNKPS